MIRELLLYTGKVRPRDVERLILHLTRPEIPFLGFLDFSGFFSLTPKFVFRRTGNTIRMYMEINGKRGSAYFLFPFRLGKKTQLKPLKTSLALPSLLLSSPNVIELLVKGELREVRFRVVRLLNAMVVVGSGIGGRGEPYFLFHPSAQEFLSFDLDSLSGVYVELLEPIPKSIAFDSEKPLFEDDDGNRIGIDNFEPLAHTLVIGESGSGKTVFLLMYLKALLDTRPELQIVIIDPHGEFEKKLPGEKFVVNFKDCYIEPLAMEEYSPFIAQIITQQIMEAIGPEQKYAERVLFHAIHLLGSQGKLSLENLEALLTDDAKRMEFVSECPLEAAKAFFDTEFTDIQIHRFNEAILPIANFISEYLLYRGEKEQRPLTLKELLEKHRVIVFSFDPDFFGKRMIRFFGSSIINQMYVLAIAGKLRRPTLLVIDEVARVESPTLKDILAETRKFNLFLVLATQYLGQLSPKVLHSILSNARNIIAFKLHEKDAELLAGAMEVKFEDFFTRLPAADLEKKKRELFVRLDMREVVVRLFNGKGYLPPVRSKTVDARRWLPSIGGGSHGSS